MQHIFGWGHDEVNGHRVRSYLIRIYDISTKTLVVSHVRLPRGVVHDVVCLVPTTKWDVLCAGYLREEANHVGIVTLPTCIVHVVSLFAFKETVYVQLQNRKWRLRKYDADNLWSQKL